MSEIDEKPKRKIPFKPRGYLEKHLSKYLGLANILMIITLVIGVLLIPFVYRFSYNMASLEGVIHRPSSILTFGNINITGGTRFSIEGSGEIDVDCTITDFIIVLPENDTKTYLETRFEEFIIIIFNNTVDIVINGENQINPMNYSDDVGHWNNCTDWIDYDFIVGEDNPIIVEVTGKTGIPEGTLIIDINAIVITEEV